MTEPNLNAEQRNAVGGWIAQNLDLKTILTIGVVIVTNLCSIVWISATTQARLANLEVNQQKLEMRQAATDDNIQRNLVTRVDQESKEAILFSRMSDIQSSIRDVQNELMRQHAR